MILSIVLQLHWSEKEDIGFLSCSVRQNYFLFYIAKTGLEVSKSVEKSKFFWFEMSKIVFTHSVLCHPLRQLRSQRGGMGHLHPQAQTVMQ